MAHRHRTLKQHTDNTEATQDEAEEVSFDFRRLFSWFRHGNAARLAMVLLLLAPLALSIYLRIQPAYLPATDDWAKNSVYNMIQGNIRASVDAQYPNLPQARRDQVVQQEFEKVLAEGKLDFGGGQVLSIEEVIQQNSEYFKERFQNEAGHTYLVAIDPYYYYRLTRNVLRNGHQGDYVGEDGRYRDTKVFAGRPFLADPGSDRKVTTLHVYYQYYLFRAVQLFKPDADLMAAVFYSPILLGALSVIPAFFLARRFGGNIAGFFAGTIVAIHPSFLSRTIGGFADTDGHSVFWPLLIAWLFIEAYHAKTLRNGAILASAAGLATGLFSFAWSGWFFILNFALAAAFAALIYLAIQQRTEVLTGVTAFWRVTKIRAHIILTAVFILASGVFVTLFNSFANFANVFISMFKFTQLKAVGTIKIWPNVYTTVAELNPSSLAQTISQMTLGSKLWLIIAFLGIIMPIILRKGQNKLMISTAIGAAVWYVLLAVSHGSFQDHRLFGALVSLPMAALIIASIISKQNIHITDFKYSLILLLWVAATIYASSKGVRFILLLVPAVAVAAGVAIGLINMRLSDWVSKELSIHRMIVSAVVFCTFAALLLFPTNFVKAADDIARGTVPSMNDGWYDTLVRIRDNSEPDAIINSWWDFGHWFAAIAERRVTLDGGVQNNPPAHWLGKLMLTWDENESVGILRYLDCGSNTGFERLNEFYEENGLKAVNTVYEIIVLEREDAKAVLISKGLKAEQADDVLQYTHCEPPENYFITSEDMVGKSGVWAHFGSWNFTRAAMYNQVHNRREAAGVEILVNNFSLNQSQARTYYSEIRNANPDQWISPWPSYAGGLAACSVSGNLVQCNNGILFDLETEDAKVMTQSGNMNLNSFAFVDKSGEFVVKRYDTNIVPADRPLGGALVRQGDSYAALIMDNMLTGSMFTRLFFFEGYGLRHFDEWHKVRDITGAKIIVWKVDWEGSDPIQFIEPMPELPETEEAVAGPDFQLARIEHILISTSERSDEEAQELAMQIYGMLDDTPFEDLVEEYSDCSDATVKCSLGWFGEGVLDSDIEEVVFSLQKGQVSVPFRAAHGFMIVKLIDTK